MVVRALPCLGMGAARKAHPLTGSGAGILLYINHFKTLFHAGPAHQAHV